MREARAEALRALATAADRRLGPGWRQRADGAVPIPLLSLLDEQTAAAIEAYVDAWCAVASVLLDEKGQFGGASSDLLQQDTLRVRSADGQLQRLIVLPTHPWLLGCLLEFQRRMARTFSGKKRRRLPLAEDEVRKLVPGAVLEAWFVYEEGHARPLAYADGAAFHLELLRLSSSKPMDFMPFTQLPAAQGRELARDPAQALGLANELVAEMDRRIDTIARAWCDDIGDYNSEHPADRFPYVVAVFDEFSEMAASFDEKSDRTAFESAIGRLAQKARAAGIHLIVCMQRPDASALKGAIKANILHRFALKLPAQHDSRVILDDNGAETLLGQGDMLYKDADGRLHRLQVPYLESEGLKRCLRRMLEAPKSQSEPFEDDR